MTATRCLNGKRSKEQGGAKSDITLLPPPAAAVAAEKKRTTTFNRTSFLTNPLTSAWFAPGFTDCSSR